MNIINELKALNLCTEKKGNYRLGLMSINFYLSDHKTIIFVATDEEILLEIEKNLCDLDMINDLIKKEYNFIIEIEKMVNNNNYITLSPKSRKILNCDLIEYNNIDKYYPDYNKIIPTNTTNLDQPYPIFAFPILKRVEKIYNLLHVSDLYYKPHITGGELGATYKYLFDSSCMAKLLVIPIRCKKD